MRNRILLLIGVLSAYAAMAWASVALSQEIVGPSETGIRQPVWLSLDLSDGEVGTFCPIETPGYIVDADPAHVAKGAAMFFAFSPGTYTVIAGINGENGPIYSVHKITVDDSEAPPPPEQPLTTANVIKWLGEVDESARTEELENPLTGKKTTRQAAVAQTFLNIAKAGPSLSSKDAMDSLLATALVSTLGESASEWQPFADRIDAALAMLKRKAVTVEQYSNAYTLIGEALIDG